MRESKTSANPQRRNSRERGGLDCNQQTDRNRNAVHLVVKRNAANESRLQRNKISQRAGANQRKHFPQFNADWRAGSIGQNQHGQCGAQRDERDAAKQLGKQNWRGDGQMLPRLVYDCSTARDRPNCGGDQGQSNK